MSPKNIVICVVTYLATATPVLGQPSRSLPTTEVRRSAPATIISHHHASTALEGYLRGLADYFRAQYEGQVHNHLFTRGSVSPISLPANYLRQNYVPFVVNTSARKNLCECPNKRSFSQTSHESYGISGKGRGHRLDQNANIRA